jgi:hypothetical protein
MPVLPHKVTRTNRNIPYLGLPYLYKARETVCMSVAASESQLILCILMNALEEPYCPFPLMFSYARAMLEVMIIHSFKLEEGWTRSWQCLRNDGIYSFIVWRKHYIQDHPIYAIYAYMPIKGWRRRIKQEEQRAEQDIRMTTHFHLYLSASLQDLHVWPRCETPSAVALSSPVLAGWRLVSSHGTF